MGKMAPEGRGQAGIAVRLRQVRLLQRKGMQVPVEVPVVRHGMKRSGNTGKTRLLAVYGKTFFISLEILQSVL